MKIFNESNAQAQDTICLNQEVKKIIQHLEKSGKIIGDDDLIIQELEQAKDILDNLIIGMQDETAHLVYYSGSANDFLKTENVDILCDTYEDMDAVSTIMGFASGVADEFHKNQPYCSQFAIHKRDGYMRGEEQC